MFRALVVNMKYLSLVLLLSFASQLLAGSKKLSCAQLAEKGEANIHYLDNNDFVVKKVQYKGELLPRLSFCPHDKDPSRCKNSSVWFTLDELVKFKALGKEVINSNYSSRYYDYDSETGFPRKKEYKIVYCTRNDN